MDGVGVLEDRELADQRFGLRASFGLGAAGRGLAPFIVEIAKAVAFQRWGAALCAVDLDVLTTRNIGKKNNFLATRRCSSHRTGNLSLTTPSLLSMGHPAFQAGV